MLSTVAQKAFGAEYKLYAGRLAVSKAKEENGAVAVLVTGGAASYHCPNGKGKVPTTLTGF